MKPKKPTDIKNRDFFKQELIDLVDESHELVMLSQLLHWEQFDQAVEAYFPSSTGKPGTSSRLIAGLFYLKGLYGLSDEMLIKHWVENPYWQYFCGMQYFQHHFPIAPATLSKWRKRIGAKGLKHLLNEVLRVAMELKLLSAFELSRVIADTTVQEKAVSYPTDSKLFYRCREQLVALAKLHGIPLRQSYVRVGKRKLVQVSRYAHAKQFRRMRASIKCLKNYLGRVVRDIERYQLKHQVELMEFKPILSLANRLLTQNRQDKNKLYSLHAPEVECISKGKAHKRYEFGVKVGIVVTAKQGWVLSAESLAGNPYDGHTLKSCLAAAIASTGVKPRECFVDLGYRGHGVEDIAVFVSRQKRGVTKTVKRWMKRRSAIEPIIGHLKQTHLLGRNYLKGQVGDAINALCAAIGYNLRLLLTRLCPT